LSYELVLSMSLIFSTISVATTSFASFTAVSAYHENYSPRGKLIRKALHGKVYTGSFMWKPYGRAVGCAAL